MTLWDDEEDVILLDDAEDKEWEQILAFIDARHRDQSKNLILAQYNNMYHSWCFGHPVILDDKMQLCFKPLYPEVAGFMRKNLRPTLFSEMSLQRAICVYMDAGVTLFRLRNEIQGYFDRAPTIIFEQFEDIEITDL
jgi:hypothetical protein